MITLKHMAYSGFSLTRMYMPQGSRYHIPAAENDKSIGVICTRGGTTHDVSPAPDIHLPHAGDGLMLNAGQAGWSNDVVGPNDLSLYAPYDTEWVCLSENGNGRPRLELRDVDGALTLAAGLGVVVIDGYVAVDGIIGMEDDYFKPREAGTTIDGKGRVILVTPT